MSNSSPPPELKAHAGSCDEELRIIPEPSYKLSDNNPPAIVFEDTPQPTDYPNLNHQPLKRSKKPTILTRIWRKIDMNPTVAMIMIKPAIASAISLAICQRHSVAVNFLNFGYLIIIVAITTVPILPRGKYLMNLVLSLVSLIDILLQPLYITNDALTSSS